MLSPRRPIHLGLLLGLALFSAWMLMRWNSSPVARGHAHGSGDEPRCTSTTRAGCDSLSASSPPRPLVPPPPSPTPSPSLLHVTMRERHERREFMYGPVVPGKPFVRILFLSNYDTYNILMHRHPYDFYHAATRHPWVKSDLWGPLFPGWDANLSLQDNIKARYGSLDAWDIINMWPVMDMAGQDELLKHTVMAYREHECWHRFCKSWGDRCRAGIYMLTYPYEVLQYQYDYEARVYVHSPNTMDPVLFAGPAHPPPRDIDVLVVGAQGCDPPIYPLRPKISQLIVDGVIPGHIHKHPGYFSAPSWQDAAAKGVNASTLDAQVAEYASMLRRAKIVVGDSSVFKYGLQKLAEIPAAGALLVTDLPMEREPLFRQFAVEVDARQTPQELAEVLKYWLTHDEEREKRARRGQYLALGSWATDDNVDGLIAAWQNYKKGRFGLLFPHPFSVGCSATGRTPATSCNFDMSPWCGVTHETGLLGKE